ncbi:hypothetical protein A2U01_0001392 [Trifolium medium]|uniref:Uncharacterized protein n=1 Tax=Trifolium medium TaxID=97028 RepID=A0A392M002_9FABA|nr:hypothetical protein [Trifolium medium]
MGPFWKTPLEIVLKWLGRQLQFWMTGTTTGTLKCNVDAAVFTTENGFRCGICIRNDTGTEVYVAAASFQGNPTPAQAKTHGMWVSHVNASPMAFVKKAHIGCPIPNFNMVSEPLQDPLSHL